MKKKEKKQRGLPLIIKFQAKNEDDSDPKGPRGPKGGAGVLRRTIILCAIAAKVGRKAA